MCFCLLLGMCVGWSSEAWAINCPNKPSGATTLATVNFNTSNGEGQLWEIYPGAGKIQQPSGAEGNASASILYAGQPTGGQQTIWPNPGSQQSLNNLYVCLRFQMAPGYVGQQTANKLFFVAAQDWPFGRQGGNGFFGLNGSGYPSSNGYRLYFGHNSGNLDNSHVCALDLGLGGCFPNVAQTSMFPGNWYTVEVRAISSTSSTSRNGVMQWWIDGVLNGNFTNLNYIDGVINQFQLNHTWDGGGAVQCGPPTNPANALGRDCRVDQIYYFDELVVAAGGASNPPPSPTPPSPTPPPPSGPPGTVSNVSVVPQSTSTALVSFSAVDDGTGTPAKYDNRLAPAPINWGATSSIASGACASPFSPSGIIGSTVTCLLTGLTPGQSYQFQNVAFRGTMNAGAIYGSLGNVASFTMPSSNVPAITNFTPASGATGVSVTITGSNFGATVGGNTVKFNGQTATVTSASTTSVTATVPDGVTTGKVSVQTDQGIVYSEQNFTVGGESSSCGCS